MRTKSSGVVLVASLVVVGLQSPTAGAADAGYTAYVLPSLGGFTQAYDISPNGLYVVGYSETDADQRTRQGGTSRAFRWSASGTEWLALPPGAAHSDAFEVGDDGTVVGWAGGCPQDQCVSYAMRWPLTGEPVVVGSGGAYALSRDGAFIGGHDGQAMIWTGSGAAPKNEAGAVWAVANDGTAAGTAHAADGSDRPAWWPAAGTAQLLPLPKGTTTGFAHAMTGNTVVGSAGSTVAVWTNGNLAPKLPTPAAAKNRPATSSARDINAAGVIVGDANGRAARWSGGVYIDLNTLLPRRSSLVLVRANGIDDHGSVVGWGSSGAFLLRRAS